MEIEPIFIKIASVLSVLLTITYIVMMGVGLGTSRYELVGVGVVGVLMTGIITMGVVISVFIPIPMTSPKFEALMMTILVFDVMVLIVSVIGVTKVNHKDNPGILGASICGLVHSLVAGIVVLPVTVSSVCGWLSDIEAQYR